MDVIYVRRLSSGLIPCFNINQYNCLLKPDTASCLFFVFKLTTESIRRGLIVSRREVNIYLNFVTEFFYGAQRPRGLRRGSEVVRCWDCGFESRRGVMDVFIL